jgi:predicted phage tail protein
MATITGAKGGSQKQHTPVEQPDSAQSMARCRMLLALGEGEFAGGLDATRIFLDGTPLGNADGTMNFENVSWDFRPGTQTQTPIPGFPAVENETTVGVSLTKATPWTRAISNTQIDAVLVRIGIPSYSSRSETAILSVPALNTILICPLMVVLIHSHDQDRDRETQCAL